MAAFPDLDYSEDGYSYTVAPMVLHSEFASMNTRQRLVMDGADTTFNVTLRLDDADLTTLNTFVIDTLNNGADTYTGPYFTYDVEQTGTLELINGEYTAEYLTNDYWKVSLSFNLKERDYSNEDAVYDLIEGVGGFADTAALLNALENTVNNNDLNA